MYSEKIPIKNYFLEIDRDIFNCLILHEVRQVSNYEKKFLSEYFSNSRIIAEQQLNKILNIKITKYGSYYFNHIYCLMYQSIRELADYVLLNNQDIIYAINKYRGLEGIQNIRSSLRHCSCFKIDTSNITLQVRLNTRMIARKIPVISYSYFPSNILEKFNYELCYYEKLKRRVSILYNLINNSIYNYEIRNKVPELSNWIVGKDPDRFRYVDPYFLIDITKLDFLDKFNTVYNYEFKFPYKIYIRKEDIRVGKLERSNYFFQI